MEGSAWEARHCLETRQELRQPCSLDRLRLRTNPEEEQPQQRAMVRQPGQVLELPSCEAASQDDGHGEARVATSCQATDAAGHSTAAPATIWQLAAGSGQWAAGATGARRHLSAECIMSQESRVKRRGQDAVTVIRKPLPGF